MKQIIYLCLAIFFATGISYAQNNGAIITVLENVHDFGEFQEANGDVSHSFVVENTGNAPLVITRVIASCGCTTPEWTKEPIAPGEKGEIKVTYDPEGRPGPFSKSINVYSNGKKGSLVLTIRGDVK